MTQVVARSIHVLVISYEALLLKVPKGIDGICLFPLEPQDLEAILIRPVVFFTMEGIGVGGTELEEGQKE